MPASTGGLLWLLGALLWLAAITLLIARGVLA